MRWREVRNQIVFWGVAVEVGYLLHYQMKWNEWLSLPIAVIAGFLGVLVAAWTTDRFFDN